MKNDRTGSWKITVHDSASEEPRHSESAHAPDQYEPPKRWLTLVEAARHTGFVCPGGRAPTSFYDLARRIGHKVHGQWRIHGDDLDGWIRAQPRGKAA